MLTVNDFGGDTRGTGQSSRPADNVVSEIQANGGTAVANYGKKKSDSDMCSLPANSKFDQILLIQVYIASNS